MNEAVEELDNLRKAHSELEVAHEALNKELTIAKSDRECRRYSNLNQYLIVRLVNLVNKDQLEILSSLRESVNEEKAGLESDVQKMQDQIKDLSVKNKMQLEQINGLLLEKINLQSEGIGQREKMLERERNFRSVISISVLQLHTTD